jgi:8-oxo-dGTP diphosphatase
MVATRQDGCVLFIRRADLGTWALPGGTLEWGETLRAAVERELREEAGATLVAIDSVSGVYSRPDRDPRFHAVTVVVRCTVADAIDGPVNVAEILEARWRKPADVKGTLALAQDELLEHALSGGAGGAGGATVIE